MIMRDFELCEGFPRILSRPSGVHLVQLYTILKACLTSAVCVSSATFSTVVVEKGRIRTAHLWTFEASPCTTRA